MKSYEIIINGTSVDLSDPNNLDLAITSAISDANNLTVRKASNTKVIKVPASGPNKIIFGHPHDINSVVSINQLSKPSVIILSDGTQIFKGYAKISGTLELDNLIEYEITCIGKNGEWISNVGSSKLSDLDYSDQNHTIDYATILASETVAVGREYVYDFIDRGQFSGQEYGTTVKRSVNISDRKPAISMASFVKRIFSSIGVVVVSNFIDSAFFEKLYWIFINDKIVIDPTFAATFLCEMEIAASQTIAHNTEQRVTNLGDYINVNPGGAFAFISASAYYVKCSGRYELEGYTSVSFITVGAQPSDNISFNIMKKNIYNSASAVTIYNENYELTAMDLFLGNGTHGFGVSPFIWGSFDFEFGDEIYYQITARNSDVYVSGNRFSVLSIKGIYGGGEGQPFDFNLNLPDTLQIDYLQGLKELFNLHFNFNEDSRRIYIEPYDDFYAQTPEDWSNKLDKSRDIQILFTGSTLSKKISYRYKSDSNDKFVEDWQKQTNKFLGSEEAVLTNVFAKDETLVIENKIFAATWMQVCERVGLLNTPIPRMWSDTSLPPLQSTKFLPRILYYDGVKALPAGESWRFNQYGTVTWQLANLTAGIRTDYPHFFSYDDSGVNDNNLFFQDRTFSSGLFQKYFRNAQNSINDGRNFIAYVNIRDIDMSNLNHQTPKYIEDKGNGAYFILDKVDNYKSQDNVTTRCYFVKVVSRSQIKRLPHLDGLFVTDAVHQHTKTLTINDLGTEIYVGITKVLILVDGEWVPDTNYVGYI